jgi:hypothetical protein
MDPIPILQSALVLSHKSLEFDKHGNIKGALESYYQTMAELDKAIRVLMKKRPSSKAALDMILAKKLKYSRRVTQLLEMNDQVGLYSLDRYQVSLPRAKLIQKSDNYVFVDYHTVS